MTGIELAKEMTESQRILFLKQYNSRKKSSWIGSFLCFFLGTIGIHRFYLGQVIGGIIYLLYLIITIAFHSPLIWFLPIVTLLELPFIHLRVKKYNERKAREIADIILE